MTDELADLLDIETLVHTPQLCVFFNIRKASRAIAQIYEDRAKESGLHPNQYSTLVAIAFGGEGGVGHLAQIMATDRTTITRNIKPLREQGLVEPITSEVDRRTRGYRLTETGAAKINEFYPIWAETQREVMERIGADRFEVLKSIADDVVNWTREPETADARG